ncbi:MAG: glycosyltransferase family 4 protein [Chloroflexia bacterium]
MSHETAAWLSLAIAFVLSALLTPAARRLGIRGGWFRQPGGRHIHARPIPRSGGLALALSTALTLVLLLWLPLGRATGEAIRIGLLIVGPLVAFVLTVRDDIHELSPGVKLAIQAGSALLVIFPYFLSPDLHPPPGLLITQVQNPLGGTVYLPIAVAVPFSLLWFVGMMNTINLLDGLDGLATGVTAIAALLLAFHMWRLGQLSLVPLPLALLGACLGFLPYNFHPARVFMGDSGAVFLGFSLAILSVIGGAKIATALLVLGVPILDVAWVIIFRLLRGHSPLQADQGHLHHRLLHAGLSQVQIVALFYGASALFGAAQLLPSGLYKLMVLLGMALGGSLLLAWLARKQLDPQEERGTR